MPLLPRGVGRTLIAVTAAGSWKQRCGALQIMVEAARGEGDWAEAERWAQRVLEVGEQEANPEAQACAWVLLGQLAEEAGDALGALARWQCALSILECEEQDEALAELAHDVWLGIGQVCRALGQEHSAQGCARHAESVAARWQAAG